MNPKERVTLEQLRMLEAAVDKDPFLHKVVRLVAPTESLTEGIEEGIPIPKPRREGKYDELLNVLKIGHSKALPLEEADSLRYAVKAWKRKFAGTDYVTRKEHDTQTVRIWRIK